MSHNFEDDLLGGGGKGRTVNLKIPAALIARSRDIDETTAAIKLDTIAEDTVPVTLGEHLYSAVGLSEGDISLDLTNFSEQVLAVQVAAVVEKIEAEVAAALQGITLDETVAYDAANPVATFTQIRRKMRKRGVPATALNVVVGTQVYADLLDANAITSAGESGSTEALREGNVGKLRGFTVAESTRVEDGEIVAFHRDAFALAARAPKVPAGTSFGQSVSSNGHSLRYLRDYDAMHTLDRSIVGTFAGVASLPLFKINRDGATAKVEQVPEGAAFHMSIASTPAE